MKCRPMKFSGLDIAEANFVIEILLVFEAKMVESLAIASICRRTPFFTVSTSGTASITKEVSATAFRSVVRRILLDIELMSP